MLTGENRQQALRLPAEKADMLHAQTARAVFGGKEITKNSNSNKPKKEKKEEKDKGRK